VSQKSIRELNDAEISRINRVPTYNRAGLVTRAIETAISQTVPCEIVVCDHGSTDNTPHVVAAYRDKVRYLRREFDSGPFFCWLDGLLVSQAEYVHITHDDDWIEEDFIEKCLNTFSAQCAFAFCAAKVHSTAGAAPILKDRFNTGVHDAGAIEAILLSGGLTISPGCAVFRRDDAIRSIIPVGLPLAAHEYRGAGSDLLLFLLPLLKYRSFGYVNECLAHFLAHSGSITTEALADEAKLLRLNAAYHEAREYYLLLKHSTRRNGGYGKQHVTSLDANKMRSLRSLLRKTAKFISGRSVVRSSAK
jgi:glycosyltransferase involved in cell wall biosynthesis